MTEKKINYNMVLRIAAGSSISYGLCSILGLKYAASAAVITLLSIESTKKETVSNSIKRALSYIVAIGLCAILTFLLGYHIVTFFLFMLMLVSIVFGMDWKGTLSSSTVVTTHFLMEKSFEFSFMLQELMLLLIGTGVAVLLNIMVKDCSKEIEEDIGYIEKEFIVLNKRLIRFIKNINDGIAVDREWLEVLKIHLDESLNRAIDNANNMRKTDSHYYIEYIEMRLNQWYAIERIYDDLLGIDSNSELPMSDDICSLIEFANKHMTGRSGYLDGRRLVQSLIIKFRAMQLPENRAEFTNMAVLADVLNELDYLFAIKEKFITGLDENQLNRYYSERI